MTTLSAKIISTIFHPLLVPTYALLLLMNLKTHSILSIPENYRYIVVGFVFIFTFVIPTFNNPDNCEVRKNWKSTNGDSKGKGFPASYGSRTVLCYILYVKTSFFIWVNNIFYGWLNYACISCAFDNIMPQK